MPHRSEPGAGDERAMAMDAMTKLAGELAEESDALFSKAARTPDPLILDAAFAAEDEALQLLSRVGHYGMIDIIQQKKKRRNHGRNRSK